MHSIHASYILNLLAHTLNEIAFPALITNRHYTSDTIRYRKLLRFPVNAKYIMHKYLLVILNNVYQ